MGPVVGSRVGWLPYVTDSQNGHEEEWEGEYVHGLACWAGVIGVAAVVVGEDRCGVEALSAEGGPVEVGAVPLQNLKWDIDFIYRINPDLRALRTASINKPRQDTLVTLPFHKHISHAWLKCVAQGQFLDRYPGYFRRPFHSSVGLQAEQHAGDDMQKVHDCDEKIKRKE